MANLPLVSLYARAAKVIIERLMLEFVDFFGTDLGWAEKEEKPGANQEFAGGRCDQSANNDSRNRIEDFPAR